MNSLELLLVAIVRRRGHQQEVACAVSAQQSAKLEPLGLTHFSSPTDDHNGQTSRCASSTTARSHVTPPTESLQAGLHSGES